MKTQTLIEYGVYDVTAKEDSMPSTNDKQEFVDLNDLKKNKINETIYATLEKNYFMLNGTHKLMNGTEKDMGWWSKSISNENRQFINPPTLTFDFVNETHSSIGLTLKFSELDYCNHLKIQYYDASDIIISEKEFYPDAYEYFCEDVVERYKKIVITFYSTDKPYRYVRLYSITYGRIIYFAGNNLVDANIIEETNLLSDELSINTLDFTTYSQDDAFNILNPQGIYKSLQERQQLKAYKIQNGEETSMGTFYLDKWKNEKDKTMNFSAIDLIGLLDKTDFMGGMYVNSSFETVVNEIMTSAGFTSDNYNIQEELKEISVSGYMPIITHREALQQLLFAVGAVANCSRSDIIKIYRINENETPNKISKANIFKGTKEIEQNEIVTGVSVISHTYLQSGEEATLFEGTLNSGTHKVIFAEPVYNITCTNGTIIESNTNYAIIQVSASANVIVKGYKYTDNMQTFFIEFEGLNPNEKRNVLKIENDYLINNNNAAEIANRVLNYYRNSYITSFDFILDDESTGNNIAIEGDFNNELNGYVTKLDIDMTGGYIANAEVIAKVKALQ